MLSQFDELTLLLRQIILQHFEGRDFSHKNTQLIFNPLRILLQLIVNPSVDLPVLINEAILFGVIIIVFIGGDLIGVVIGFPIDFYRYFRVFTFQSKVDGAPIAINISEGILEKKIL